MSFPTPKGSLAKPLIQLRTMASLSKEFQKQTNSDTANDALKHISFTRVGEDKRGRPFACVLLGESHGGRQISGGGRNFLIPEGDVGLYMTIDTNPLYKFDLDAATIDAANFFGTVADEIVDLSGADNSQSDESHLPITQHRLAQFGDSGPEESNSIGDFFFSVYLFDWGMG